MYVEKSYDFVKKKNFLNFKLAWIDTFDLRIYARNIHEQIKDMGYISMS